MKKINWPDHFVSLLVVILGISIAFFLENKRESFNLSHQESEYIAGLLEELSYNAVYLDTMLYYNELIFTATQKLTNATLGQPIEDDSILARFISSIQLPVVLLPQRTAYESLKSSGKMTLISDFQIRNKIISLHEYFYEGAKIYDQAVSEHVRDYIKPYVIDNVTYLTSTTVDNTFLEDHRFQKIIFQYMYSQEARNNFYQGVQSQTNELIEELNSYSTN